MPRGAPDWYEVKNVAQDPREYSLNAGEEIDITPTIIVLSCTIFTSKDIEVYLNDESTKKFTIKANRPFTWDGFSITKIHIKALEDNTEVFVWMEGEYSE